MNPHSFSFMDPKNKIKITEKVERKFVLVIIKKVKLDHVFLYYFLIVFSNFIKLFVR